MIEQVLNPRNVMQAYQHVVSNKGSAGVDDMSVNQLYDYLQNNRERIGTALRQRTYLPQSILGVAIPKSNGKTRLLGIHTVINRLLQQAVAQVIIMLFEMEFQEFSYGFRPNRNVQQAVIKAFEYQQKNMGTSFIEIVSNCNSGWKMKPVAANKWMEEHMFPVFPLGDIKTPENI